MFGSSIIGGAPRHGSALSFGVARMNKLMAILFLLGAIGGFGMSQRDSFLSQPTGKWGPVGKPYTVQTTRVDKIGFFTLGTGCMAACLYFVARIRRDDLKR